MKSFTGFPSGRIAARMPSQSCLAASVWPLALRIISAASASAASFAFRYASIGYAARAFAIAISSSLCSRAVWLIAFLP